MKEFWKIVLIRNFILYFRRSSKCERKTKRKMVIQIPVIRNGITNQMFIQIPTIKGNFIPARLVKSY